ncbi:Lrp/AsnC ligand binding domain-containing protein [Temperatibacter marinus]|uniref:Lrp/AsnC ligand binding domain-containing protein n=1 Tax=Temperatibacter marinus TaxID=1456591 RepID=A0AA52EHD5_9PROT|nr:Lrp/AsnC ligand binding domain-containing protein [Temperatibacter marinus]WND02096.1 Lrp/AsnC ligand binding domain-containing protein [Temperatibacter marinus]
MKTVFVQIKCELGRTYDVAAYLADEVEEVRSVYSTSGQYDLLAQFTLSDDQEIGRFVNSKVQTAPGLKDTYTIIGLNAFTEDAAPGPDKI